MSCLLCGHVGQFAVGHLGKDGKHNCGVCEKCVAIVRRADSIFEQLDDAANNMEGAADKLDKQGFDPIWVDQLTTLQEHLRSEAKECFDLIEELKPENLEAHTRKVNDWQNARVGPRLRPIWIIEELKADEWVPVDFFKAQEKAVEALGDFRLTYPSKSWRLQEYRRNLFELSQNEAGKGK